MNLEKIIKEIDLLSNISPIIIKSSLTPLVKNNNTVVIDSNINSKELGVVNGEKGKAFPKWFENLTLKKCKYLLIDKVDLIDLEEQEKFYEILKYRTITGISIPRETKILLTIEKIENISKNILSLCQVYL